jgi:serine/threonine protein kinase/tetratricopeptide (TPR) repeat protein
MNIRAEDWPRVKAVLEGALARDGATRAAYVTEACGDDADIRHQVDTLLASHDRAGSFLETSALATENAADPLIGRIVGAYRLEARIGAGGMGEVYKAHDTKLDRPVALKLLPAHLAGDPDRLRRFHAEARAASSLNHPYILVIHDFGELDGRPFIVTEYVEGEPLRQRIDRGALPVREAVEIAIQLASALGAAHTRGIIHRDIKPENVMLRPDGYVKVLDFGLAKLLEPATREPMVSQRTQPGIVMGTPLYMSPEQARGLVVDLRSDVWSLGIVVYEMLEGRPPFQGTTAVDVIAAVLQAHPASLAGTVLNLPTSLTAIIRTALAKDARERFASAREMQAALIGVRRELDSGAHATMTAEQTGTRTRLVVLPFRILKPDAETDFLAFSLPDAVSASLANLESLIVRSSLAGRSVAADSPAIAHQYGVDVIVSGTLIRQGDQLRVAAKLIDGASGTLKWSHVIDVTLGDLFGVQDSLVDGIVKSLALQLTGRDRGQLRHDVPASAAAYEYYLRANELSQQPRTWRVARDLYRQALEEDRRFAPAWVQLARVYRLLAKYQPEDSAADLTRAEEAVGTALRLNPDLSSAHRLLAQLEVDRGYAEEAMVRLVVRARDRAGDTQLLAALVHVCRVCGLMDASLAAYARVRTLDPRIDTGVMHTYWLLHRYEEAIATADGAAYVVPASLVELGRADEARALIADLEQRSSNRLPQLAAAVRAFMSGRHADGVKALQAQTMTAGVPDPELLFYVGRHLVHVGESIQGLSFVQRAFEGGYFCYPVFADDPWLNGVRADPAFQTLLTAARARWQHASAMFVAAGGPALLNSQGA